MEEEKYEVARSNATPPRRLSPRILAGTHLYTWVKRSTVKVEFLA